MPCATLVCHCMLPSVGRKSRGLVGELILIVALAIKKRACGMYVGWCMPACVQYFKEVGHDLL